MVKINLGSGPRHVEDWISFDNSPRILIRKFMRLIFFAYLLDRFSLASEQTWDFGVRYGNVRKLNFENNTVDFLFISCP
jgi:hypothetical protein